MLLCVVLVDLGERDRIGVAGIGASLPAMRPGCGAKNVEPGILERLKIKHAQGMKPRKAFPRRVLAELLRSAIGRHEAYDMLGVSPKKVGKGRSTRHA